MKFISAITYCLLLAYVSHSQTWVQTNGPYGGNIVDFAVIGNTLFAGTSGIGVVYSSDHGNTWVPTSRTQFVVQKLVVDDTTLYAGTNDGLFWTNDMGKTWVRTNLNFQVCSVVVRGDTLLAGTRTNGVYRSFDKGVSWTPITNGISTGIIWSLVSKNNKIFAGTTGGVYVSTDHGSTWTAANNGIPIPGGSQPILSLFFNGNTLFASGNDDVFFSTDFGASWSKINNSLLSVGSSIPSFTSDGTNIYASTQCKGVFRSPDNGTSWTQLKAGLINTCIQTVFAYQGRVFAGTMGGGIFLSSDAGDTWAGKNNNLKNTWVTSLAAKDDFVLAGTIGDGLFKSTDDGLTWLPVDNWYKSFPWQDENTSIRTIAIGNNSIFTGSYYGASRSVDDGQTWTYLWLNNGVVPFVECFAFDGNVVWAGLSHDGGVVKSLDNGDHWSLTGLKNITVNDLCVSESTILAATHQGIFVSQDQGANWSAANSGLAANHIKTFGKIGKKIIIGTDQGVYVSKTNGNTWSQSGLSPIYDVTSFKVSGSVIYGGLSNGGVVLSADSAVSWVPILSDSVSATSICISGATIFAGDPRTGVWKTTTCTSPLKPTVVDNQSGNGITLHVNVNATQGIQWFLNGQPITGAHNPDYIPSTSGSYSVQVSTVFCKSEISNAFEYEIPDPNIEMPNVFTPNGDIQNPVFKPMIYKNIQEASLVIVNRWGREVFITQDVEMGWDGDKSESGTYYYILHYIGLNGKAGKLNGWVQIIR